MELQKMRNSLVEKSQQKIFLVLKPSLPLAVILKVYQNRRLITNLFNSFVGWWLKYKMQCKVTWKISSIYVAHENTNVWRAIA